MEFINETWASFVSVGLAIAILYSQVGTLPYLVNLKGTQFVSGNMASLLPCSGDTRPNAHC